MRKLIRITAGLTVLFLSGIFSPGCNRTSPPKAPDEVRLQLKWLHQAQFAGFYLAQEKGYYAQENLKVTFLEGGPDVDNAGRVMAGKADFVIMSPDDILLSRSQGASLTALAATDKLISENPGLITRFLRASLRGWQEAVEDYQQAVAVTLKYAQGQNPGLQTAMMEAMLPLIHNGEDRIGWMKPGVWQGMYATLSQQGILEKPFDVNRAFTMRFLNEVYGGKTR